MPNTGTYAIKAKVSLLRNGVNTHMNLHALLLPPGSLLPAKERVKSIQVLKVQPFDPK